jgi:hypothetical protein
MYWGQAIIIIVVIIIVVVIIMYCNVVYCDYSLLGCDAMQKQSRLSSSLKMETCFSETSVNIYQTTQRHIPSDMSHSHAV